MELLVVFVLVSIAGYVHGIYEKSAEGLTEVPTNIPSDEQLVDLSYNDIKSVDGELDHITDLQVLRLGRNSLTSCPNLRKIGQTLQTLALPYNDISKKELEGCLDYLTQIRALKLDGTFKQTGVPDFSSVGTTLTELVIGVNVIKIIDGQLDHLDHLSRLHIHGNRFKTFPNISSVGDTLTYLTLSFNSLSTVTGQLDGFTKLIRLELIGNRFVTFPNLDAVGATLKTLWMQGNDIENIPGKYLKSLTKLSKLDLSNNKLLELPDFTGPSHSLTSLKLNDNPIEWVGVSEMQALDGISATVELQKTMTYFLPKVCLGNATSIDLTEAEFDPCLCSNIWVKGEIDNGTLVLNGLNMNAVCDGAEEAWGLLATEELTQVCKPLNGTACNKGKLSQNTF